MLPFVTVAVWLMSFSTAQEFNSTFYNPIIPGFHPDPSCVFVPEWNDTFFCASSSFNAFPGIPLHASKDLQNWKLVGMFHQLLKSIATLLTRSRARLEQERTAPSTC